MGSGQTDTGGRVSAVGGLPSSAQSFAESEAVRLFVDRARSSHPTFAATTENLPIIARICRRLDGIPLAIELAAARSRVLSPAQIDARLDDRFRLLATGLRGGVPRHQTLKAAIDWSYESLSEPEKHLLSRLSVFVGGCSLAAIEAVCADEERPMTNDERPTTGVASVVGLSSFVVGREAILDLLTHLVNKSLVLVEEGSEEAQYRMLETIRQYAEARLREAGEWEMIRERHRLWSLQDAGSCDAAPDRAG